MNLLRTNLLNFRIKRKIILIIWYKSTNWRCKTKRYQNPLDLFIYLTDGNINLKEVLKDQIKFKSDLGEIKKGNSNSKSKDEISVIQNFKKCFDLREKIFFFKRLFFFAIWS